MLISLTNSVNLSSRLSHPLDWDSAVLGFQRLRASGHAIPPGTELEIWATSHGWYARAAHELGELADAISAGRTKRLKGGSRPYGPEIVDYWIEQSTGREDPL